MNRVFTRNISFQTLKSFFKSTKATPSTDLQKPLTSLPNATGSGAFVEPITYQVLGSSSNLLNIKLPKSSILNIRYSNSQQKIIALNGHINSMYTEFARSRNANIIFQRCFNQNEPMSFLIASNAENSNFAVIPNINSKWIVKKSSLFAWSGSSIKPSVSNSKSNALQLEGDGTFVIATPGKIIQIDLADDESIQVNSNSVIAYTSNDPNFDGSISELSNSAKSVVNLSLGKAPLLYRFNWLKKYISLPKRFWEDATVQTIHGGIESFFESLKKIARYVKYNILSSEKKGYFIDIKGPKKILLTNAIHVNDKILDDLEVKKLLS